MSAAMLGVVLMGSCVKGEVRDFLSPEPGNPNSPGYLTLSIYPRGGNLDLGDSLRLSAWGHKPNGDSVPAAVSWLASGGSVDNAGWFKATASGTHSVRATSLTQADLQDSVAVRITADIVRVEAIPDSFTIVPGAIKLLQLMATRSDSSQSLVEGHWATTGGSIGPSGVFTAGQTPGRFQVYAMFVGSNGQSLADTTRLEIVSPMGTLTQIIINPAEATLPVGDSIQFTASGHWTDGSITTPAVTWTATGGTISAAGMFTAGPGPGTFSVTARQQGGSKTASSLVTVTGSPTVTGLALTPEASTLHPGQTVQFSTMASWSDGQTYPYSVSYSTTGGTITTGGLYTAGTTAGSFLILATCACGQVDTATAIVAPAATLAQLVIDPPQSSVAAGGKIQFSASGTWTDGSKTTPAVTWTATGGTVSASGLYTAGATPGAFAVTATHQGGSKTAASQVTVLTSGGFAGPDQTVNLGTPVRFAATPAANLSYRYWSKISGPGVVKFASEQFNSSFEDPTFADWMGANPVPTSNGNGLQGVEGNWVTIQNAMLSTDHVRSGSFGWKARTPIDWPHAAKLLRWRFDNTLAYYSVWVYWPSNLTVNGHGSGGFTNYLNLVQWKERTQPWNPTWVIGVSGKSGSTTLDEFIVHDWYNKQPIKRTGVTVPKDQWFNITAYMKEGFGTSGQLIVWLNNKVVFNQSNINTLGGATNKNPSHLMWGVGNYSNALVGQGGEALYFDDAVVVPGQNAITTTTATFSVRGTYVLRMTASNGTMTVTDDVTVTVR